MSKKSGAECQGSSSCSSVFLAAKEICRLLKISRSTLYRYVAPDSSTTPQ